MIATLRNIHKRRAIPQEEPTRVRVGLFADAVPMIRKPLVGNERDAAIAILTKHHYAHSFPSGKSHIFDVDGALVVYSIPANNNLAKFVLGRTGEVWELTRLWAPNGHERNLLSRAISVSVGWLRKAEPKIEALVSYADPNVGHAGGVYRAASWVYTGQSEESRYYKDAAGQVVARRKFHAGSKFLRKAEILALGYTEFKMPGKHRFVRGLSPAAKRSIRTRWEAR